MCAGSGQGNGKHGGHSADGPISRAIKSVAPAHHARHLSTIVVCKGGNVVLCLHRKPQRGASLWIINEAVRRTRVLGSTYLRHGRSPKPPFIPMATFFK